MAVIDENWDGLSVIMPAYNAAQTVGEQLEALAGQDYPGEWELLVVDNRSTDETTAIVQRNAGRIRRLRLVTAAERQGRAHACNVGARAAAGRAFIFCDADDVADAGWLSALAQALQQHAFVAATIEVEALNRQLSWHPRPPNWATQKNLGFLPFAGGALMAVSRRVFEALGGFDERAPFCEDIEFSWRLQLCGFALQPVPAAIMLCVTEAVCKPCGGKPSAFPRRTFTCINLSRPTACRVRHCTTSGWSTNRSPGPPRAC